MTAVVYGMPASTTFNSEQALESAKSIDMKECLIVGYDTDGDLVVRSSRMDRKDAMWLCVMLHKYILEAPVES